MTQRSAKILNMSKSIKLSAASVAPSDAPITKSILLSAASVAPRDAPITKK
jgi:hypothetical protein